jgi:hypothetical protein
MRFLCSTQMYNVIMPTSSKPGTVIFHLSTLGSRQGFVSRLNLVSFSHMFHDLRVHVLSGEHSYSAYRIFSI